MRQADLLSVDEARERILGRFRRLESESVPIGDSLGRVLAEEIGASHDLPPFANSSMDGFALQSASTLDATADHPTVLTVTERVRAGSVAQRAVDAGSCIRIMTGAPLPEGADAVIPFEEVEDRGDSIVVANPAPAGACVRPAGNDVRASQSVLAAGTLLGPPQVGLLAAIGCAQIPVVRRPVVAVLSTGDELMAPGTPLRPGQIYNSNTPMLAAAVAEAGGRPRTLETTGDEPQAIAEAVKRAEGADLLLTSGGASVGDFDYVADVIGAAGELSFWKVRVRPGKPLVFGSVGDMPVMGLPGNPTSALVTFEQFARPAIRTMLGTAPLRPEIEVVLDERIDNRGGRQTYARVRLRYEGGRFHAVLSGRQDSAMLLPLAAADGLLIVPEDRDELEPGEMARVQVWRLPVEE